jgi:AcrR family transcriptional regulator
LSAKRALGLDIPGSGGERPGARERVMEAACDLFYRKGIRAVGVEMIAETAKTTKMSLYRYFASKDELVAEWLRRANLNHLQWWDEQVRPYVGDPRKQLTEILRRIAEHLADPASRGCPAANAAVEITDPEHPARHVIEEHKANIRVRLERMCTDMGARDPAALADGLFLLLEGAQASTQSLGHDGPARAFVRTAEALIEAHRA